MARSAVPSQTGGRQLGDLDLDEHLAKFRDRQLVLIVALISGVAPATVSGIRGLAMNEVGECPRCKLEISERAREVVYTGEDRVLTGSYLRRVLMRCATMVIQVPLEGSSATY